MNIYEIQEIEQEYERRRVQKKNEDARVARANAADYAKRVMDYEDLCKEPPTDPGNFWCQIGFHGKGNRIWDPQWNRYTYGHCTRCGRSIGSGFYDEGY